jgi:hypothetical protein
MNANAPYIVAGHVTTEKTKKTFKAQQVMSLAVIVASVAIILTRPESARDSFDAIGSGAAFAFVGGIVWRVTNSVRIWWNHG